MLQQPWPLIRLSPQHFQRWNNNEKKLYHIFRHHSNKFVRWATDRFGRIYFSHDCLHFEWRRTDENDHVIITFIRKQIIWSFSVHSLAPFYCCFSPTTSSPIAECTHEITDYWQKKWIYNSDSPNKRKKVSLKFSFFHLLTPNIRA